MNEEYAMRNQKTYTGSRWLAILSIAAASCSSGGPSRTDPAQGPQEPARRPLIMDQLHNGGTEGFLFLPPMVPRPASLGDNLPELPVTVRVDEMGDDGKIVRSLATFTTEGGPKRERLRFYTQGGRPDPDDDDGDADSVGYYLARWKTADEHLSNAALYRVRVLVPARGGEVRELGFADVDVVRNQREFRSVDQHNFTPLINGEVLRIKFRVDRKAVDGDSDGIFDWRDNCPDKANPDQADSPGNGIGDACRCDAVACAPADSCHAKGACDPRTGACDSPALPDGTKCPVVNASATCKAGACQLVACDEGWRDANGKIEDGCEEKFAGCDCGGECGIDLSKDVKNCGACGNVCEAKNGTPSCVAGACGVAACNRGFADCNKFSIDGCETDLLGDAAHCGACLNKCVAQNGIPSCVQGACGLAGCQKGFADCNRLAGDGCEVSLTSDTANCGACGRVCVAGPNAAPLCRDGACAIRCATRSAADCDGKPETGCEVDLTNDNANCGGCGVVCGAGTSCVSGACVAAPDCLPGTADCNGDPIDKCEVQLASNPNHCGACGVVCSFAHAFPVCTGGGCGFSVCHSGYADCDGQAANGCEAALGSDGANCGACGNACAAGFACAAGACAAEVSAFSRGSFSLHACAVLAGGAVRCWGQNDKGQLGDGTTTNRYLPVAVPGLADVVQVSTGLQFTCARTGDGRVLCWGGNMTGYLGDGTFGGTRLTPAPVLRAPGVALDRVIELASGSSHSCARRDDGTIWCWGWNQQGQLGDGTQTHRAYATLVQGAPNPVSLSAGYNFTCAALGGGGVSCWGFGASIAIPGAAQFQTTPLAVPGLSGAVEVGCGGEHSCARLLDGTVRCWGDNDFGQLGDGSNVDRQAPVAMLDHLGAGLGQARELVISLSRSCARVADGGVRCAGSNPGDGTTNAANRAVQVLTAAGGPVLKGVTAMGTGGSGTFLIQAPGARGLGWGRPVGDGTNLIRLAPVSIQF